MVKKRSDDRDEERERRVKREKTTVWRLYKVR